MNNFTKVLQLIVLLTILLTGNRINSQNHPQPLEGNEFGYRIIRGERPPVELNKVPKEAYEPGRFKIKILPDMEKQLPAVEYSAGSKGYVVTGHSELDQLNERFSVKSYKPYFAMIYNTNSRSSLFAERHRAWGFHLWFEIIVDENADIIDAVKQFASVKDIELAEPEYKKSLVIADPVLNASEPERIKVATNETDWLPSDPQFGSQWHYRNTGQVNGSPGADISLHKAWEIEKGNPNVIVAVIDGGIDRFHVDLAANMWEGIGYNFYDNSPVITPLDHGAHVAGTVSAVTNNAIGVAGVAGGSGSGNGVRLMSCQVFISNSNGQGFHLAPVYAADNGAAISQNSWGYTSPNYYDQAILDAIDYFNVNGGGNAMNGGITIFAAGNSNSSANYYPAFYSGAFAVAATNNQDQKSWYSNYGNWIDISAPGGETNTIAQRGVLSTLIGNTYGYFQGTSMACPHTSGVAALMISMAYGQLSPTNVADILRSSTDNHYPANPSFIGQLGTGRLNAHAALMEVQSLISSVFNPQAFTAQAIGTDRIDLSWIKNDAGQDVMILWSFDDHFDTPVIGQSYVSGTVMPNGGTVLYTGNASAFSHTGLQHSTTYYYKAFSFDESFNYSIGITAATSTACAPFLSLPFSEDFNQSQNLPICWDIADNQGNGQVWKIGTIPGGLTGAFGNYAFLNSDGYGSGNSQNSDLISPTFDLTYYTNVNLKFDHYFRAFSGTSGKLYYSINNGLTWVLLQTWTTTTSNPATYNNNITALAGKPEVKFKWNYSGSWGYYWCVDNIEVAGTWNGPIVDFYAEPVSTYIGQTVTFTDNSSNGVFNSWFWDFGENAQPPTTIGQGPHQVVYSQIGYKSVSLTVNNLFAETKTDYIHVTEQIFSSSATFTQGELPTDRAFTSLPGASSCPGTLIVTIPDGAQIVGVDVNYTITAITTGRISHQRSQLRCVSPGGSGETAITSGTLNAVGTQQYNRTGLDIANGVSQGGDIVFELHAGRSSIGSGCTTTQNKVDNNSWTVTVFYKTEDVGNDPEPDFYADSQAICPQGMVQFFDLTENSPEAWEWSFPGALPDFSTEQNPQVVYPNSGIYDVALSVYKNGNAFSISKDEFIIVSMLPDNPTQISGKIAVCADTETNYYIQSIGFAEEYVWEISPPEAGYIYNTGEMCSVFWLTNFRGNATIRVRGANECGNGEWSPDFEVSVANCYIGQLPPGWEFTNTGISDQILIPMDAVISLYGNQPSDGSFIGVFYQNDNDDLFCGGAVRFALGQEHTLISYGHNPETPQKDGFAYGESYVWKIFDSETSSEYEILATYKLIQPNPNGNFGYGLSQVAGLDALMYFETIIQEGWSGFSLPVTPINGNTIVLFSEIIDNMVIIQNDNYVYWPDHNMNTFPEWQSNFGAQVKMTQDAVITLKGIPSENIIQLHAGWNYLPVSVNCDVDVMDVFSDISQYIEVIKGIADYRIYWPEMSIQSLQWLEPGKAYLIKLSQPVVVTFPNCE